jgi:hypothetical protein
MDASSALARAVQDNFAETIGPQILSDLTHFITQFHLRDELQAVEVDSGKKRESDASKRAQNASHCTTVPQAKRGNQSGGSPVAQSPQQADKDTTTSSQQTYADVTRKPSEATKSKPLTPERTSRLVLQATHTPASLQDREKQPKPIKVLLQDPAPTASILVQQIQPASRQHVKAVRQISKYQILVYSDTEHGRARLIASQSWLKDIKGELFRTQFRIVLHKIQPTEDLQELATKIQVQNNLQNIPRAYWLGGSPNRSGTIVLGLDTPEEANKLLDTGLALDYEIKSTYLFRTRARCSICKARGHQKAQCTEQIPERTGKRFYKERKPKATDTLPTSAQASTTESSDIDGVTISPRETDDSEDCIVVTGTQKRRILTPAGRRGPGRPRRFSGPKDSDQDDLDAFFQPLAQAQQPENSTTHNRND